MSDSVNYIRFFSGTILTRIVSIGLLLWALVPGNPYGYYILMRWILCASFAYLAVSAIREKKSQWVLVFGVSAGIYNPFFPLHLGKEIWFVVNIIVVVVNAISLFQFNLNNKTLLSIELNIKQKIALWAGISIVTLMVLFPPWKIEQGRRIIPSLSLTETKYSPSNVVSGEYKLLFNSPHNAKGIDVGRLSVQIFIVLIITSGMILSLKNRRKLLHIESVMYCGSCQ